MYRLDYTFGVLHFGLCII
ncbi:hypothetical protein F383_31034 [Gossypium arboreum]|uniref:Uncharacterized protein n=1 Tax=Gossypium arboreum TaxID=29729 RepID=A0A0B0PML3_GOSAR|nr:hypothetical protein F383_31034 [Gossypium arboreum]